MYMQDRFVSRIISKQARRIISLAGDAVPSRHWSGLAKERTGRAEGDTVIPEGTILQIHHVAWWMILRLLR